MLRLIAAIDSQRGIATDAGIPWNLPTDKEFYVGQIKDGVILMGAGTYHEFRKPMEGRTSYVLTHSTDPLIPGFEAVHDLDAFLQEHAGETIQDIGGAGLFALTIERADELILTRVEGDFHCTKFFPEFEQSFECVNQSETHTENGTSFRFETWHPKQFH